MESSGGESPERLNEIRARLKRKIEVPDELRRLLRLRAEMSRRMPKWMRMDEWRFLRIARKDSWRRPKGLDNKIRKEVNGYPPRVKIGYGKPALVRGLHQTGCKIVQVCRPEDVERIDPEREAAVIAHGVGLRKRIEIVKRALERGVKVINVTDDVLKALSKAATRSG